ncbi:DUF4082 domain-containing protein [Emticicia sp. C21]|nr:DUF4082 domain-containing protein [Emticicia sp. C21]
MRKQVVLTLLLSLILFSLLSCQMETQPIEEGFTSFLADSTMKIKVTATNNPVYYEFGLRFQVLKEGKVVKFGTRLPNSGTYRVSIWDFTEKTVLLSQNVIQTQANTQAWADISGLAIKPEKEYFISVVANNWNDALPKAGGNILYPIIKGSVKVLGFGYASQPSATATPRLPNETNNTKSISGFVDFGFIPNN